MHFATISAIINKERDWENKQGDRLRDQTLYIYKVQYTLVASSATTLHSFIIFDL